MKTVLVIGGGVTGLSAIYELHKWKKENQSDVRLILTEASSDLGGKIRTVKEHGFLMEAGADSIVTRKANMMSFIEELGLESEIVYNASGRSFIYTDGEIKPIPADAVFGIPASVESLAKSTLISAEGKIEALKDFYTKNETFTKNDSIGEFLEFFFGKELVEKQIAPVLSGVYSGKLSDLTIASTLPYVFDYKEEYGSIIKGFEANNKKFQSGGGQKFISFRNGLGALIDAFEEKLELAEIIKNMEARKIERVNNRYQVTFNNQEVVEADHIVLAIPHSAAENLIDDQTIKSEFATLENSSLISVYVGFDVPDHVLPEDGTGFIAANDNELKCNACTWTSRKWGHTSENGHLLVRLFYKSVHSAYDSLMDLNEEELLQVALEDIRKSLKIHAEPVSSLVTNWSDQMPNYLITHRQSVETLEKKLEVAYPGVTLAGCSYYGVGIPDCIENGEKTAKRIIKFL
ncbi:protoporphyrinogen oxidase [Cytobacillus solani]|uniref:Coproporphyrinogen III oxidase n=1 Tax=Cytobacillus solani TaxID=1637975 RepID=A0A0Q3SFQ7_9BACI|nr:protoporphyrinogen oxidase [Cytobacillus solani]KOP70935.1 protoporphyrinogen oxidase [Bacillus sp. FJAT-21945]KQL18116.1 protoporphyrinogen oxidase [Cytobacillus solani]USK55954.1 protoporphyrinogen oxidase [Cytobacillus solani]